MSHYRFAIIGGGPAGLFAALHAALAVRTSHMDAHVILYERNRRPGAKLLATGSGQCNITCDASVEQMLEHYGEHGSFLRHALHAVSPHKTMNQFTSMGLPLVTREDGKVFPSSFKASDVRDILVERCLEAGVEICSGIRIETVSLREGRFILHDGDQQIDTVDALVLATGGKSYPRTGSSGDGYRIAASLGHSIVDPRPALSAVDVVDSTLGTCSGIALEMVSLSYTDRTDERKTRSGPLLVTHTGLSGPVILNASRDFTSGDHMDICWLTRPDGRPRTRKEIEDLILSLCNENGAAQLSTIVHRLGLPTKLTQWLLRETSIDGNRKAAEVGRKTIAPLASLLAGQRFTISLKGAFSQAMVTAGGVKLSEVDSKTMRSRLVEHLYFAGELLDIDGDTGGYNLQAAWSTGALAGSEMIYRFT